MAKDKRITVSGKPKTSTAKKRKSKNKAGKILTITMAVFLVLLIIFGIVLVKALTAAPAKKDTSESTVNVYDTTPVALQGKVAYYAIGLLGAEQTGPTEMLALVCHDKGAKTLNVLEVPQDTYLGDNELWAVKKAGYVWGNPAPLDWCEFEGKRIYKVEIQDHVNAGHTVSKRTGSSSYNLISVFNEQYALPVDAYFLLPQEAFVKLVDLLGGLDVDLESPMTVGGISYGKGVKTLDGAAALHYVLTREKGVAGDINRIVRQRKVFLALFQRLQAQKEEQLEDDSLLPVMNGSTPIKTNMSNNDMVKLVRSLSGIQPAQITTRLLPGEVSDTYFSVHRSELVTMLNEAFNPYDNPITEADLQVNELAKGGKSNVQLQTMSEIAVPQTGVKQPTASTTAASSTAATTTKKAS